MCDYFLIFAVFSCVIDKKCGWYGLFALLFVPLLAEINAK